MGGMITPYGRENSIRSLSVMTPLDEESEDEDDNIIRPCTKRRLNKILTDHRNGYQLHSQSLIGLNKKELTYLCTAFAGHSVVRDETDKLIQQHEEQIRFLTKELDRMHRYQRHSQSVSSFDQFGGRDHVRINLLMEDIDEKFEPSMTEDKIKSKNGYGRIGMHDREDSASSTRIDPVGAYTSSPLKLYESEDEAIQTEKELKKSKACCCIVM